MKESLKRTRSAPGYTILEGLLAIALLAIFAFGIVQIVTTFNRVMLAQRMRTIGVTVANAELELVRNLPYTSVGVQGSIPAGVLPQTKTVTHLNQTFTVAFTVRNIDDPFDGTIGGTPQDLSPADYKLVEVRVQCLTCGAPPVVFSTHVSPRGLETATGNGALFINVFDALGVGVPQANVTVSNNATSPPILIQDTTNNAGRFQIVDLPPATSSYRVVVSKSGFSQEQTHPASTPNPNPTKPDLTVLAQTLTQASFSIDRVSSARISTIDAVCQPIPNVSFTAVGAKLIGTNPNIPKTSLSLDSGGSGEVLLSNLEWDTYAITIASAGYNLAGSIPLVPVQIPPNTQNNILLALEPQTANSLLVTVKDSVTQLPLRNALVRLTAGTSQEKTTSQGFLSQTNWQGGPGQTSFTDPTRFAEGSGIDYHTAGEMRLATTAPQTYVASGNLTSSTFDTGTTSSRYIVLNWQPASQPTSTTLRFQFASNNDAATWNYVGPDGTASTYYTTAGTQISSVHNDQRYFRYRAFLATMHASSTPILSDVSVSFSSGCLPPGQVFFPSLSPTTYLLEVIRSGYQTWSNQVLVSGATQQTVQLLPQ